MMKTTQGRATRAGIAVMAAMMTLSACGGGGGSGSGYGSGSGTGTGTGSGSGWGGSGSGTGSAFALTALVGDMAGAAHTDANLVNPWGLAFNPSGFSWVANNGTQTSTLYDGNGVPQSLVVTLPAGSAGAADPTGIVFNGSSSDFMVSQGGNSGSAAFIFDGEGGTIQGWAPGVLATSSIIVYDGGSTSAVFKGLAIAGQAGAQSLYATDFHNARVDVFDTGFHLVASAGGFTDPNLPKGYAPFGIQAIGTQVYVTYAPQDAAMHDEVDGAGNGLVDVFDTSGNFVRRLVTGGALNAPWGLAMAPSNFGAFSGDLLVGNFGDGLIHAYDPATGNLVGTVSDANGAPLAIPGLWAITFGNGQNSQPTNTLFYTAGPSNETHGVYGRIDLKS